MRQLGGGTVASGVLDAYPKPPPTVAVALPIARVNRLLGMDIPIEKAADILRRLEFEVEVDGGLIHAAVPDHRLDISQDAVIAQADLIEEITRIYGYDKIPDTIMADEMPPQRANIKIMLEERIRDILVGLGPARGHQLSLYSPRHRSRADTRRRTFLSAGGRLC